jgi:parallel beta-helix repeat protein
MWNRMGKKGLVCGILILFVTTSIVSALNVDSFSVSPLGTTGSWLYVGGSGPSNYTSIQDAIDHASAGDTVFVYNGTYYECLFLDKTIHLIGENRDTTIIDGEYIMSVISLYADECTVNGFTLCHGGSIEMTGPGVLIASDFNIISDNHVIHNFINGIGLQSASNNTLVGNTILDNEVGMYLEGFSAGNTIYHNNFVENGQHAYDGGVNTWYELSLQEGNYWDDYTGTDTDGDGIGDIAYTIPGSDNEDVYPFMNQNGWEELPEQADLVITDIWETDGMISYQIHNIGDRVAPSGHQTGLFVDDMYQMSDVVDVPLFPGERLTRVFDWDWECTPLNDTIKVMADVDFDIAESNETNNSREEVWMCDITSPVIVSGPFVQGITEHAAELYWETDEESDSIVKYDPIAGLYSFEEEEIAFVREHRVTLSGLNPSTTYHCKVLSRDLSTNLVESSDIVFETRSTPDFINPTVALGPLGTCTGRLLLSAEADDNQGVDCVKFFVDGIRVFTDYSYPYQYPMDSLSYDNGNHELTVEASDLSERSSEDNQVFPVYNPKDAADPSVSILSPNEGDTVSGTIKITVKLSDDVGLFQVKLSVDGEWQEIMPLENHPKSITVTFELDTTTLPKKAKNEYRLGVEVWDTDNPVNYNYATCDVYVTKYIPLLPPHLKILDRDVTRYWNYFGVSLTVYNNGEQTASNIVIHEDLRGFQPIAYKGEGLVHATFETEYDFYTKEATVIITSDDDIPAGGSLTFNYYVVPVLFYPGIFKDPSSSWFPSSQSFKIPEIGLRTSLHYDKDQQGFRIHDACELPTLTTWGEGDSIPQAYWKAIKEADYLLVTNPVKLAAHNSNTQIHTVYTLLSTMAELALHKNGVLGYFEGKDKWELYNLLKVTSFSLTLQKGAWSSKLKDDWCFNGYLLLVGEEYIVPGWNMVIAKADSHTSAGWLTWEGITDSPYASTNSDSNMKPELSIGRIIGDNASELQIPINTSINVYTGETGYEFNRTESFLVSGSPSGGGGYCNFADARIKVSKVLYTQGVINTHLNTPDFAGKQAILNVFFPVLAEKGIVFLAGHGSWDHCDAITNVDISSAIKPFGSINPFVFLDSCVTGKYYSGFSFAESFLHQKAGVVIAPITSGIYANKVDPVPSYFYSYWDADESIGLAFKQLKRSFGTGIVAKVYTGVFHLFGDPRFAGVIPGPFTLSKDPMQMPSSNEYPTVLDVTIPEYTTTRVDGVDYVEIPGGDILCEPGKPALPCYRVFYDYPPDYMIYDVRLLTREEMTESTGLNIPDCEIGVGGESIASSEVSTTDFSGFWPDTPFTWDVFEYPEKKTLMVTINPFLYNPLTTDVKFFKQYQFSVDYSISATEILSVTCEKDLYELGEEITIEVIINNPAVSAEDDLILDAEITEVNDNTVITGFPMRKLTDVTGIASCAFVIGSNDLDPGAYHITLALRDLDGKFLDKEFVDFQLGNSQGLISSLMVTPKVFDVGDMIQIDMTFDNTGTIPIDGTAVTAVYDSIGLLVKEFNAEVTQLLPLESMNFNFVLDTTPFHEGCYELLSYVAYNGKSTDPIRNFISTSLPPTADFIVTPPSPVSVGQLLTFDASSSVPGDAAIVDWFWDFDDDVTGIGVSTSHRYVFPGDYVVTLVVTDEQGLTDTCSQTITLVVPTVIDIDPNTIFLLLRGRWVTCYIELYQDYLVENIDVESLVLNDEVEVDTRHRFSIGDHDKDGISDLMVKFNFQAVKTTLSRGNQVAVTIQGQLYDGTYFEGTDYIRVI